jgi:serine/threonine protein kinase/Tol biopolymer transport system component
MSTDRWQRLDRLFVDALQRQPETRAAFVRETCGDDVALREEVESLLTAAESSGEFMTVSAMERLAQVVGKHGYTLTPGEDVGAYHVLNLLGAGATSEVWRARDTRLGRDVALKVLLPHLSSDASRVRRFADEARAVGSLNHPNILAVHDVGDYHGAPFLVSEWLDGETLRARLQAGAMRAADVVSTGLAVARGLAAAHARGIVHRDLKPENVFIGRDGAVKILDFGVAKLLQTSGDRTGFGPGTMTGTIVGTAGYMSPEQVRGEEIDARTDLFALGVMLYEMLAGSAPFKRASSFETLQAILTFEPPDIVDVNRDVPEALAGIIMRLLRKDRTTRFQSAADLVWSLEQVNPTARADIRRDAASVVPPSPRGARRIGAPVALAAAAAVAAIVAVSLWTVVQRDTPTSPANAEVTRFTWSLPSGISLTSAPAVSPDGRHIVFTGSDGARSRLYIRSLGAFEAVRIDGSDFARQPFWSPDSQWVGFFARGRVMKVSLAGGAPVAVADDRHAGAGSRMTERGGAWGKDGVIVYGANFDRALAMVPAAGGIPTPATRLAAGRAETSHRFPSFLPDGRHYLYQSRAGTEEGRGIFVRSIDGADGQALRLLQVESTVLYAPIDGSQLGVLLYVTNGRIDAQRFDPARRTLVGSPRPLASDAGGQTLFHPAPLGASSHVLAYATQFETGQQINVTSPDGGPPTALSDRHEQQWPRISPDGTRMAWLLIDPTEPNADIWVEDLARRTRTRITTAQPRDLGHVWSPDGLRLAYRPDVDDRRRLSIIAADGAGVSQDLVCPRAYCEPTDWSSDGRELIVNAYEPGGTDVWAVAVAPGGTSRPLVQSSFNERDARLSPDRRWLAYVSDEAGRPEVSVRSLEGTPRRYTVSPGGGDQVVWQRDGRALYYIDPKGRLRKVSVHAAGGDLSLSAPAELPVTIGSGHSNTQYDVAPDGRIYYLDPTPPRLPTEIRIVLGWQRLLE